MRNVTFLIADDSKTIRNMVCRVLKNNIGCKSVFEAADGNEAIAILKESEIDIIVSDWDMPNLSGEELLYEVRNTAEWRDIPFIMMTSYGGKDFIMTAVQNGVSQYIVKPCSPKELEDKIRRAWNAASKRNSERYAAMPDHQAIIKLNGKSLTAELINVSRTGAMLKVKYNDELKLYQKYELSIEVAHEDVQGSWSINPIIGILTRIEAEDSFHPSSTNCYVGFHLGGNVIDRKVEEHLNAFLKWLASRSPEYIMDDSSIPKPKQALDTY